MKWRQIRFNLSSSQYAFEYYMLECFQDQVVNMKQRIFIAQYMCISTVHYEMG